MIYHLDEKLKKKIAQSAGTVEYPPPPPMSVLDMTLNNLMVRFE